MKKTIFLLFIIAAFNGYGQDLTCVDFKEGNFKLIFSEPFKHEYKIVRKGNQQIEILIENNALGQPIDSTFSIIEWINDCTYRLTFDESKAELTDTEKFINSLGGPLNEMIKIDGNCFYFKSTMSVNGQELVINGQLFKE